MTGLGTNFKAMNEVGHWLAGTSLVTVRSDNRLGYYDKLIGVDQLMVYSELLTAGDPKALLAGRYPFMSINLLRSLTQVYTTSDFTLESGKVKWLYNRAPKAGTRLAVHYQAMPVWLVTEHPHTARETLLRFKQPVTTTPEGSPLRLPLQAVVRYDFLV
jgi:hypothetical protein